jgi:hypothetical protein
MLIEVSARRWYRASTSLLVNGKFFSGPAGTASVTIDMASRILSIG